MEAMEKRKPGTVSQLFRSHPTMATRIKFTQNNVQELLTAQPQYVVTTSEFQEVTQQLARMVNARKGTPEKTGPTLRRSPGSGRTRLHQAGSGRASYAETAKPLIAPDELRVTCVFGNALSRARTASLTQNSHATVTTRWTSAGSKGVTSRS